MFISSSLLSAVALSSVAYAKDVVVNVGADGNSYSQSTVTADVGDTVSFHFQGRHNVIQAAFDSPCSPLSGGFSVPIQTNNAVFTVAITDTDPKWFYCSVAAHCQGGMVGVINPPNGQTQADFAAKAQSASSGSAPGGVNGGQLVVNGQTSGSLPAATGSSSSSDSASVTTTSGTGIPQTVTGVQTQATSAGSSASSTGAAAFATAAPAALALFAGVVAAAL